MVRTRESDCGRVGHDDLLAVVDQDAVRRELHESLVAFVTIRDASTGSAPIKILSLRIRLSHVGSVQELLGRPRSGSESPCG